jgi:hypothetical protein
VKRSRLKTALVATLLGMAGPVHSADSLWIVTGEVYKEDYYAGINALIPLPGYAASRPGLAGAAYLGVRYQDTSLSPPDPGNGASGNQLYLKGQLEGEAELSEK